MAALIYPRVYGQFPGRDTTVLQGFSNFESFDSFDYYFAPVVGSSSSSAFITSPPAVSAPAPPLKYEDLLRVSTANNMTDQQLQQQTRLEPNASSPASTRPAAVCTCCIYGQQPSPVDTYDPYETVIVSPRDLCVPADFPTRSPTSRLPTQFAYLPAARTTANTATMVRGLSSSSSSLASSPRMVPLGHPNTRPSRTDPFLPAPIITSALPASSSSWSVAGVSDLDLTPAATLTHDDFFDPVTSEPSSSPSSPVSSSFDRLEGPLSFALDAESDFFIDVQGQCHQEMQFANEEEMPDCNSMNSGDDMQQQHMDGGAESHESDEGHDDDDDTSDFAGSDDHASDEEDPDDTPYTPKRRTRRASARKDGNNSSSSDVAAATGDDDESFSPVVRETKSAREILADTANWARTSAGRYRCPHRGCIKTFQRKFNGSTHYATHFDLRQFSCPQCPRTFTRSYDLKRHCRLHEDGKWESRRGSASARKQSRSS
ncbi:Metallothionein expression activator [Geranomyces variabilis]|uniref:Metallothionein expression activator n=1 Tax=Geranomyces variabilis TaxID=109894 RepID=A0AAD5TR63_9FUNG|nr:Metallothionein expression activator [Geranomyces variabilis]